MRTGRHQLAESVTAYGPPLLAATLAETTGQTAAAWTKISVPSDDMAGAVVLPTTGARTPHTVFYTNSGPQDRFFLTGEYLLANDGVCIFPSRGDWWILLPQVGAAPVTYNFVLFDAQGLSPLMANLIAAQGGGSSGGSPTLPSIFDTGAISESLAASLVRAALTGQDLAAAAGAKNKPISAELYSNLVASGRNPNLIEALYTIAGLSALRSGSVLVPIYATNTVVANSYNNDRLLVDSVLRGDDGATYSAVGARGSQTSSQLGSLLRLLTDGTIRGCNPLNSLGLDVVGAMGDNLAAPSYLSVLEARARGYWGARLGRRYVLHGAANLAGLTGATAFTATAPTLMFVCGATKSVVLKRITVTLHAIGTTTSFGVIVKTDTANRFTSGGTALTPVPQNNGNVIASGLATIVSNAVAIVATAEGGGTRQLSAQSGQIVTGSKIEFLYEDGAIQTVSGSLLLYLIGATAAPAADIEVEYEEVAV